MNKKDKRFDPKNKILQLTGNLRNSLQGARNNQVKKKGRFGALMFTNVPYSAKHNKGLEEMFMGALSRRTV